MDRQGRLSARSNDGGPARPTLPADGSSGRSRAARPATEKSAKGSAISVACPSRTRRSNTSPRPVMTRRRPPSGLRRNETSTRNWSGGRTATRGRPAGAGVTRTVTGRLRAVGGDGNASAGPACRTSRPARQPQRRRPRHARRLVPPAEHHSRGRTLRSAQAPRPNSPNHWRPSSTSSKTHSVRTCTTITFLMYALPTGERAG